METELTLTQRAQRIGSWALLASLGLSLTGCIVIPPRGYRHYVIESPRYEPPPPRRYSDRYNDPAGPQRRDGYRY